jgi:hypothetical protein
LLFSSRAKRDDAKQGSAGIRARNRSLFDRRQLRDLDMTIGTGGRWLVSHRLRPSEPASSPSVQKAHALAHEVKKILSTNARDNVLVLLCSPMYPASGIF